MSDILAEVGLTPDFGAIAPRVLEAARARGVAVHALLEADAYGYLDEADVTPVTAPYLDAARKFIAESGAEHVASEFEVRHPSWNYVGHPDRLCWLQGRRALLDWKCTESPDLAAAGRQLAAYRLALNASAPSTPVDFVAVVQLTADGRYRYHDISHAEHEPLFLAAVSYGRRSPERRPRERHRIHRRRHPGRARRGECARTVFVVQAGVFAIQSHEVYTEAAAWLRDVILPMKKKIAETFRPRIAQAHALHKGLATTSGAL